MRKLLNVSGVIYPGVLHMAKDNQKKGEQVAELTKENIDLVEKETIDKVNKTISALEAALATWNAAKEKPDDLKDKFAGYEKLHDALVGWESKALKSLGKKESFGDRVERLREFVDICCAYS